MTDAEARVAAKSQLIFYLEPTATPALSDQEVEALLDLPGVKRAATWAPDTAYKVGDVVVPTIPNGHCYRCVRAGQSDATQQDSVRTVAVTNGGSAYTTAPSVSFSGGGGTGAIGYAVIDSGQVIAVVITDRGSGYTAAPTVSFSGGDGAGAAATASVVGIEPSWPLTQGARRREGVESADGTQLTWEEAGPGFDQIYDVRRAAYLGWDKKSRKVAQFVDTKDIRFSQIFDHCIRMRDSFAPVNFF